MDDFDPLAAIFSQAQAAEWTKADVTTIDNWVRYKHILPARVGNRRLFSFLDLLIIDLTYSLSQVFRSDIEAARFVAGESARRYIDLAEEDWADASAKRDWQRVQDGDLDSPVGFDRDPGSGGLRRLPADCDNDRAIKITLPVNVSARRLMMHVAAWAQSDS